VRLAGLRQIAQPRNTARTILGIQSDDALVVVRELGIANLAIATAGTAACATGRWPSELPPQRR
jgi:hypothetical protein